MPNGLNQIGSSNDDGYTFDKGHVRRIASAVRYVEDMPRGVGGQYAQYQPPENSFWAEIQDPYTNDQGNTQFSWLQLWAKDDTNPGLAEDTGSQNLRSGSASGNDFAIEINNAKTVPFGTAVRMWPSWNGKYFLFEYAGSAEFFAVIYRGTDPSVNQYSWARLDPQMGGGFAVSGTVGGLWLNPSGWAQDVQGSTVCLSNERIRMSKTQDFYTFVYEGRTAVCNTPSGGIAANSSDYCIVNVIDSILVYNPSAKPLPGSTKILIDYSPLDTKWYAKWQDCTS